MAGFLNILPESEYLIYEKTLNIDNLYAHVHESNKRYPTFYLIQNENIGTKSLKIENYYTGEIIDVDESFLTVSGTNLKYQNDTEILGALAAVNIQQSGTTVNGSRNNDFFSFIFKAEKTGVVNQITVYPQDSANDLVIDIYNEVSANQILCSPNAGAKSLLENPYSRTQNLSITGETINILNVTPFNVIKDNYYNVYIYNGTGNFLKPSIRFYTVNTIAQGTLYNVAPVGPYYNYSMNVVSSTTNNNVYFKVDGGELTTINSGIYKYKLTVNGKIYYSELFRVCSENENTIEPEWLISNSFLKIIKNATDFIYEKFANIDNKSLHLQIYNNVYPDFNFDVTDKAVGSLVSFKIVNYDTTEQTTLNSALLLNSGSYYYNDILPEWVLSGGLYYYLITFQNEIVKSEVFKVCSFSDVAQTNYIITDTGDYITDELGNKIKYK